MREASLRSALSEVSPPNVRAAALFLALPRSVAPTIEVREDLGRLWFRNHSVACSADPVHDAVLLAEAGWEEGDEEVDLTAPPWEWVKVVHSGVRRVVFGLDVLWGGPLLSLCQGVPLEAAASLAKSWVARRKVARFVSVGEVVWPVRSAASGYVVGEDPQTDPGRRPDVDEVARAVAEELSGRLRSVRVLAERDGQTELDVQVNLGTGWEASVPVLLGPSNEVLGAEASTATRPSRAVVPGWEVLGACGPHVVGRHAETGVVAFLTPSS